MKIHKKGNAAIAILGLLLIAAIIALMYNQFSGECHSDTECPEMMYCGVDKECHPIPVVEKTVEKNSLLLPSIILALGLFFSTLLAMLFKERKRKQLQDAYDHYYRQWYESQVAEIPETKEQISS